MGNAVKATEQDVKGAARGILEIAGEMQKELGHAASTQVLLAMFMAQQLAIAEGVGERLDSIERLLSNIECRQAGGIP